MTLDELKQMQARVFQPVKERWTQDWPNYHRYGPKDEAVYIPNDFRVSKRMFDPYNRNKLKGDYPINNGQLFFVFTGTSDTQMDGRRVPVPSGLGSAEPGAQDFFGKFGQYFLRQNIGLSFDLYHGDTSFKPMDWRIKFTPEININYLWARENGVVNPDVRVGNTRLDTHVGLQEAFAEVKLMDIGHLYDFVSARAGIQTFNSDFRGFVFFDQEPGLRIFGNLKGNRYQYNAAYFAMLEKDSNSGLNSMKYRNQQVMIANLYRQDFIKPGYDLEVNFHYDKDEATVQYDTNGFVVRPAAIGKVKPHAIRSYYYGLLGNGHIGRLNLTHAFYQVLGHDTLNQIAGRPVDINAQMVAAEVSLDRDWVRYRASFFWSSGDSNPRDGTARGFDSIFENSNFAGGFFSFWNRESIRLTSTGVALMSPGSLIPSLRSSPIQGQANYVNPGIFVYNAATQFEITQKLRGVLNMNMMRFHHTEPLQAVLFQQGIHAGIGADSGVGVVWRPALSENITFTGVFNIFKPFQGFQDIYVDKLLYSLAGNVRLKF